MDKFVKLGQDMVLLWSKYKVMYSAASSDCCAVC